MNIRTFHEVSFFGCCDSFGACPRGAFPYFENNIFGDIEGGLPEFFGGARAGGTYPCVFFVGLQQRVEMTKEVKEVKEVKEAKEAKEAKEVKEAKEAMEKANEKVKEDRGRGTHHPQVSQEQELLYFLPPFLCVPLHTNDKLVASSDRSGAAFDRRPFP